MLAGLSSSSVTNAIELHIKGVPISSSVAAPASEESVTLSVPDELSLLLYHLLFLFLQQKQIQNHQFQLV